MRYALLLVFAVTVAACNKDDDARPAPPPSPVHQHDSATYALIERLSEQALASPPDPANIAQGIRGRWKLKTMACSGTGTHDFSSDSVRFRFTPADSFYFRWNAEPEHSGTWAVVRDSVYGNILRVTGTAPWLDNTRVLYEEPYLLLSGASAECIEVFKRE